MEVNMQKITQISPIRFGLIGILLLWLPSYSIAGREPEQWDTLPQIQNLVFSKTSVGFVSDDHRYFILDRLSKSFQQVEENLFIQEFPSRYEMPAEVIEEKGIGSRVRLKASNGDVFETENAYCSEGEDIHHKLWKNNKLLKDNAESCESISAVEILGDQLWLGTRYDGEYGDYPAKGVVIQSYKGSSITKRISQKDGLSGDLVRVIRLDPYNGNIWVITQQGFNEIGKDFKIVNAKYFYEDFDSLTGKPVVLLSSVVKQNNPLAVVERLLAIKDTKAFYDAVSQIPEQIRAKFSLYNFHAGIYSSANIIAVKEHFTPREMNVLIPFFIEAAQSNQQDVRSTALSMLCMFNDRRIFDLLTNMEKNKPHKAGDWYIRDCLDKYTKLGLVVDDSVIQRIQLLLDRIKSGLANIRSSTSVDQEAIVEDVKSLKVMGNLQGMQLINNYFLVSDGNPEDGDFYDIVVQQLHYENEIIPAVVEGLKKIQTSDVSRGCSYFDMRYEGLHGTRYDAKYAEAILRALEHALYPSETMRRSAHRDTIEEYVVKGCSEAFKSQMQNQTVKEVFRKDIYPHLSELQKDIVRKRMP